LDGNFSTTFLIFDIMNYLSLHLVIVLIPLILSNVLHMLVIKQNLFPGLNIPVWTNGFGANKTWRGLIYLPVVNSLILSTLNLFFVLSVESPALLGFVLGSAYMIFELPNSYLKRKIGIKSGEQHTKFGFIFSMIDKMDSAFGVALTYLLLGFIDLEFAGILFVISCLAHIIFSKLLVILKIKKSF